MDFIVSRFSRLFPAFWVSVATTYIVVSVFTLPGREVEIWPAIINLTMLPRVFGVSMVDGVYWSLEKELFFYFAMYCIYKFGMLNRVRELMAAWLVMVVTAEVVFNYWIGSQGVVFKAVKALFLFQYIPFFSIGIVFCSRVEKGWYGLKDIALIVLAIAVLFIYYPMSDLVIVGFYLIVFYLLTIGKLSLLSNSTFIFLGGVSYPLYLIHQNLGYVIIRSTEESVGWFFSTVFAVASSLILAFMLNRFVEQPSMGAIRARYSKFKYKINQSVLNNA